MVKNIGFKIYLVLVFISSLLLVGAGLLGLSLNESKLENLKQNEILLELREKISSGQLEVDEGLGLILVQGIEDAHIDAANFIDNVYAFGIGIGLFLIFLSTFYVLLSKRKGVKNART